MAMFAILVVGVGVVAAAQRIPASAAHAERFGGLLLVASLVGLGLDLAQAAG